MDLLELLRKRGMDGDVDLLREALRVLVDGIMTGGPENLSVQGAGREPLVDDVRKVSGRYDWVIVDGPPGISADAVRVADVVLIPAKASAFDVVGRHRHRGGRQGPPAVEQRYAQSRLRDHHGKAPHHPRPAD